jgi:beta-mannosidase
MAPAPDHRPAPLDLGGTWRAAVADEGLQRAFAHPDHRDDGWAKVEVPGHWRSSPDLAFSDGPVLHRRTFEGPPPAPGDRAWLVLDGLFYQGDVWLDGAYLGDTEGYFLRHSFEVTDALRDRSEHLLAVEVTCSPESDRTAKRNITGVFQHWDSLDPDWNPGGIWRPVRLEHTGPVRARSLRVTCSQATAALAVVRFRAELDSDAARTVCLRTSVGPVDDVVERPVAEGSNFVEWSVAVAEPELWWPHALGSPTLHDVAVEVEVDGACSHRLTRRTGLRSIALKRWVLSVNGERLFVKGANHGPTRMALAEATPEELRRDVALAVDAGLDLLRLHAHVTRPELYDAADEAGLLLWQDFPLQWGYARTIRRQAARQASAMVDHLGHHPSVALWCGHNEPFALDVEPGRSADQAALATLGRRYLTAQQLPSWNKTILDRTVRRAIEAADASRPVIPHAGVLPSAGSRGTDAHLYFGWYHGHERDLPGFLRAWPRLARFVGELGAQAVPTAADFCEPDRWPDLDWPRLERTHGLQRAILERHVPSAGHPTLASWAAATQAYQATLLKHQVEALRRLKYAPTGGFAMFAFADGHPAVSWSVLDHRRCPKAGHAALVAACRPVIVVSERLPATVAPGDALALDVHVVSDLRTPLDGVVVTATVRWPGGEQAWTWEGHVPADAVVRVGTLAVVVPDAPGELAVELALAGPGTVAANRDTAPIAPPERRPPGAPGGRRASRLRAGFAPVRDSPRANPPPQL